MSKLMMFVEGTSQAARLRAKYRFSEKGFRDPVDQVQWEVGHDTAMQEVRNKLTDSGYRDIVKELFNTH